MIVVRFEDLSPELQARAHKLIAEGRATREQVDAMLSVMSGLADMELRGIATNAEALTAVDVIARLMKGPP